MNAPTSATPLSSTTPILSYVFGLLFFCIGIINTGWGNDPGYGIFVMLLSLIYFLPVARMVKNRTGYLLPRIGLIRILVGLFILWSALGVGELMNKIDLMLLSF